MKTSIFIVIVLLSGAFAGLIHGTVNFALVEPYLDQAIGIENQNLFESRGEKGEEEEEDTAEFWAEYHGYRTWQKSGQILAGVILGTSMGALFGIVYALSRNSLPGDNDIKKSLFLAATMWFVLYLIPFLKYPANPPTVGDGESLALRTVLYLSFVALSGVGALGFYKLLTKLKNKKKFVAVAGYVIFINVIFLLMPENPDKVPAAVPMTLLHEFRLMSVLGVSSFWISIGVIFGLFWNHFESNKKESS